MDETFERYQRATARLDALIEHANAPADKTREAIRQRAEFRMGRLRRFLERLGNPHLRYPIVHVGGTSGKGSTSTAIAAILTAAGYRTGLHTSPYIQTAAEKLQLNGKLIDPDLFANLTDRLLQEHDAWLQSGEEALTYGEMWIALTVTFFAETRVDVAVIEVGAGGRFDLTNIVTPVTSVITSVGLDHTHTLGNTIAEIAWHKAGIIKRGVPAVTAATAPDALEVIAEEARLQGSTLTRIPALIDVLRTGATGTTWRDSETGIERTIALGGRFQARNGATAVTVAHVLGSSGFAIPESAIAQGLRAVQIPGRVELIQDRVPVLLDGAHNPEKVAALAADVPRVLPTGDRGRRIGILGALEAKQADEMIHSLIPVVDAIVATSPQVLAKEPKDASAIAGIARDAGFSGPVHVEPDPRKAIAYALTHVDEGRQDSILVTGSLYLVGNIRGRWFGEREIVLQQTSWPQVMVNPGTSTPD